MTQPWSSLEDAKLSSLRLKFPGNFYGTISRFFAVRTERRFFKGFVNSTILTQTHWFGQSCLKPMERKQWRVLFKDNH
ncbi:unnamed protein product [Malus baccata var. baccata]